MTYLEFHLLFILPPIAALAFAQRRRLFAPAHRRLPGFLAAIAGIAFVYTVPWDNYLVWRGVWQYGSDRVLGVVGYVPVEEYLFFLLQPLLTGLWFYWLRYERGVSADGFPSGAARWAGTALYAGLSLAGILTLFTTRGQYAGLILAWSGPVLAGQWAYAGARIWAARRLFARAVAVPTLYLWLADWFAIRRGIWHISETFTTGLHLFGLPIEEALFFLVTNLLVVQGLLLFLPFDSCNNRNTHNDHTPEAC